MPDLPKNLVKWKKQWEDLSKHETRLAEIANKVQGQKMAQALGTPTVGNALTVDDIQYLTGGMSQSPADAQTTAAQQGTITAPVQEEVVEASPTDFTRLMTRVRGLPRNQQQSFIDNIPVLHPRDKAKALKQLGFK